MVSPGSPWVRAGDRQRGPGRAAGAAGPVDLPQAAAGGQPAASGAAGAPGHRLRAIRAHRADRRALPARLRRAAHQRQGGGALDRGLFLLRSFVAKVLLVQSRRLPGWVLPAAGGTLAVVVGVLWYTSSLWYYNGFQLPA